MACEADLPTATIDGYTKRAVGLVDAPSITAPEPAVPRPSPITRYLWGSLIPVAFVAVVVPWATVRVVLIAAAVAGELVRQRFGAPGSRLRRGDLDRWRQLR